MVDAVVLAAGAVGRPASAVVPPDAERAVQVALTDGLDSVPVPVPVPVPIVIGRTAAEL